MARQNRRVRTSGWIFRLQTISRPPQHNISSFSSRTIRSRAFRCFAIRVQTCQDALFFGCCSGLPGVEDVSCEGQLWTKNPKLVLLEDRKVRPPRQYDDSTVKKSPGKAAGAGYRSWLDRCVDRIGSKIAGRTPSPSGTAIAGTGICSPVTVGS